jgi:AcrR family transcriptional regulator
LNVADRRVKRTRDAVLAAFAQLLMENGYDRVTVAAVIARANVGRSTFYEHFENKQHVFRASFEPLLRILAEAVEPRRGASDVTALVAHFWEQRHLVGALLRGSAGADAAAMLTELIEERLLRSKRGLKARLPATLAAAQIAGGQIELLRRWAAGDGACDPAALAAALCDGSVATARAHAAS